MLNIDKRLLNFAVIIFLSIVTFAWTSFIFHESFHWQVLAVVIVLRLLASLLIFKDYSLSWSKATQKTFLIKTFVYSVAFAIYMPYFYSEVRIAFLLSELAFFLVVLNSAVYLYHYIINKSKIKKDKVLVIYGAGEAGLKLKDEFNHSEYTVKYFVDDSKTLQGRSIDAIHILSFENFQKRSQKEGKYDLAVIAIPSASRQQINTLYENIKEYFNEVKILPSLENILHEKDFSKQLQNISVEDLLARHPKDLDKKQIENFIKDKVVLITGAGGSIGSEISRQCKKFGAKQLILVDHSEFNLYTIVEELRSDKVIPVMQTVRKLEFLEQTFAKYKPQIVIHAAAYKHVPLCEANVSEAISNNVLGTKNCIDLSIKYEVEKFVLISTDKAVRPTNVMGTTKRICELYAQNANSNKTEIVAVRFGNVLGSSGSVIPKFKEQIQNGGPITVTHPDITRYFMLIPEACELVLQAASIGKGGEIFILDMGEPIKIVDLAKKMIELTGRNDIEIQFCGLRPGEKLYEELLINDSDAKTQYESITVASPNSYDIEKLSNDIEELSVCEDKLVKLKEIVPEFNHQKND